MPSKCNVPNQMETATKKKAIFGLSLTQSSRYQSSVGCSKARCEYNRVLSVLRNKGWIKKRPKGFRCKI